MEQVSWYLVLVLGLSLAVLLKLKKRGGTGGSSGAVRLPPGPWQLPVIGSLHHLAGKPLVHRALADLARRLDAPGVMSLKLGEVPVVVATSAEAAREIMKTRDAAFATRPRSPTIRIITADGLGIVFAPYGALWRQLRKICVLELLSARRVQSFRHVREDEVGRFVASIAAAASGEGAEAVNVSASIDRLVADSTLRAMIGDRFEKRDEFLKNLTESMRIATGFNLGDLFPSLPFVNSITGSARAATENHHKSFELMDYAIKQHEERKGKEEDEDLVDVLLRIHREGGGLDDVPLTMGDIKEVIVELFTAGSDTASTTLEWAMSELMRNPRVMKKAQSEVRSHLQGKPNVTEDDLPGLKYLRLVIKETLRLHPAGPLLIPRECMEPCKVLGYDIPKGTVVWVNAWAIGRDPKY